MKNTFFLEVVPQPIFIIFVSTFAGAFVGEFYKEANNGKPCTYVKFLSKFLASWLTAAATILLMQSIFEVGKNEVLMALSMFFGFVGHKDSIKYVKSLVESKFKSN